MFVSPDRNYDALYETNRGLLVGVCDHYVSTRTVVLVLVLVLEYVASRHVDRSSGLHKHCRAPKHMFPFMQTDICFMIFVVFVLYHGMVSGSRLA